MISRNCEIIPICLYNVVKNAPFYPQNCKRNGDSGKEIFPTKKYLFPKHENEFF